MNLIPWKSKPPAESEGSPLVAFRREMDRLFDTFLREPLGAMEWPWREERGWLPALDVSETEQEVTVSAELPGIDPKQIDVSITGQQLVISGEKRETTEKKERDQYHSEIRYGAFRRVVPLPEGIDPNQVDAQFANGVLTLSIKKSLKAAPKKIEIKSG